MKTRIKCSRRRLPDWFPNNEQGTKLWSAAMSLMPGGRSPSIWAWWRATGPRPTGVSMSSRMPWPWKVSRHNQRINADYREVTRNTITRSGTMKSVVIRVLMAWGIMVASGAVQTAGAAGPLPLKEGTYVLESVPCDKRYAGNTLHYYQGDDNSYCIGVPHGEWKITRVHNNGNAYHVTLRCIYKGVEGIATEHRTIFIKSATSFSIPNYPEKQTKSKKKEQVFRWCDD